MSSAVSRKVPRGTSTRDAILAASVEILQREGAGALTMRSVATAAGCSTTGVYTWFGSKNGLVEAIFVDGFVRFGRAQRDTHSASPDEHHLGRLGDVYRQWALANPTHYMVMFGKAVPDFEPSEDALNVAMATFVQLVEATSAVMERAGFEGEPAEIAMHLWAGIHGYVSLELAGMDMAASESERDHRFHEGMRRLLRGCLPR